MKLPNRDFAHLPDNELLVTGLARRCRLPAVEVSRFDGHDFIAALVARYDRSGSPQAGLVRLHQEDFCQALGLPAHQKYEADGGPEFAALYRLVRDNAQNPLRDNAILLRWLAFCVLVGNADGHAKNLSMLLASDGLRLAPLYDFVCTQAYRILDRRLAFAIGGERDPGRIARRHWEMLADTIDVGSRFVLRTVEELADATLSELDELERDLRAEHGDLPVLQTAARPIRKQCRRTLTLLRAAS